LDERMRREGSLSVNMDRVFLHVATSFVENTAIGLGLDKPQALSLTLATEEIFEYLCEIASPEKAVHIRCRSGGYYVQVEFVFFVESFDLHAFNLTAGGSIDVETNPDEMRLLIASRAVDRFELNEDKDQGLCLLLVKEKAYPALTDEPVPPARPLKEFSVRDAGPEELKIFSQLTDFYYQRQITPTFLQYPGKLVDMVKGGHYQTALAVDTEGHVGGGIVWHWRNARIVEGFGPYVFNQPTQTAMAGRLVEACLGAIARTPAMGLLVQYPTHDLPKAYFEPLGHIQVYRKNESKVVLNAYFRQMHEDAGAAMWSHPDLQRFLQKAYDELALPREIRLMKHQGESQSRHSVLATRFDLAHNRVDLRPIRPGMDLHENVVKHLKLLAQEGVRNIFFVMDLAVSWQAHFTPSLLQNGLEPKMVLPYAGKGDEVVFQLKGPS